MLRKAVFNTNHSAYELSALMVESGVVQGAVARLINMGFYPLFKEMTKEIKDLNTHADSIFDIVVRENKKADAPTSTEEK